jgi:hypothetical protein
MIPNAKPHPERFYKEYPTTVGFPCGTLSEVIRQLTKAEQEAMSAYKRYYKDHEQLGYEIIKTYFEEQWNGYEDCNYYFVIVVEEKEEVYQARLTEWKRLEKERLEAKARIKAAREEAERVTKIKELEEALKKLKGD